MTEQIRIGGIVSWARVGRDVRMVLRLRGERRCAANLILINLGR